MHTDAQERRFKTECHGKICTLHVYIDQNIPAGFLHLHTCHIALLNIFPAFQKKGFGTALLAEARKQATIHGCSEITLYSFKYLVNFYEKNGFTCNNSHCNQAL